MFKNITRLDTLSNWRPGSIPLLDGIRSVLAELGTPQNRLRCVHIAGTNGKGSTAAYLSSIFAQAGYKVGLTISPHLADVTERIVVDGVQLTRPHLDECLGEVFAAIRRISVELTYFETIVAAAFVAFEAASVDICILEVGLGGIWDATNVIVNPEASVITSISLDHQETLGNSVIEIAHQKAGILKQGSHTIVGRMSTGLTNVFRGKSSELYSKSFSAAGEHFGIKDNVYWDKTGESFSVQPSLLGRHQLENAAVAIRTAMLLGIPAEAARIGVNSTFWPGRLERVAVGKGSVLLEAAHNLEGAESLRRYLIDSAFRSVHIVFGAIKTKQWKEMIEVLRPYVARWSIFEADSVDKVPLSEMGEYLSSVEVNFTELKSIDSAISHLKLISKHDRVIVCGSIYMLGRIRSALNVPRKPLWVRNPHATPFKNSQQIPVVANKLSIFSKLHDELVDSYRSIFGQYLLYMLELPAKMLRSQLCCALSNDLGGNLDKAASFGAALEILHSATLVHDDLPPVDNSPVRRGKDSLHVAFSEAKALLAGDVLFGMAVNAGAEVSTPFWKGINGGSILSAAIRDVSIGQILDVDLVTKNSPEVDVLKTGTLFSAAAQLGLLTVENVSTSMMGKVGEFGLHLGKLFQLRDDLEDGDAQDKEMLELYTAHRESVFAELDLLEQAFSTALNSFRRIVELTAPASMW